MRVNPDPYPDLLAAVAQAQQQLNTDEAEVASGLSVNVPSDNPAAAAALIQNADQSSQADQFERSVGSIQGELQSADSAISNITSSLQQAISLGTEGANGTVNSADRTIIATQVQGIQSQLLSLANLSYQGNYVFGGTLTQTAPYVLDDSSGFVSYQGNSEVNKVTLGSNFSLQTNLPGSTLFSSSGTDMFQSIEDLISSLQSGNNIGGAVVEVSNASAAINTQQIFYSSALDQLTAQNTYLGSETTQLAQQADTEGEANLPAVISNLTQEQTALQATLESIGQTANTTLFEYLKG